MSLRLGIDTGGTFTDAALLDADERVVATAKALTTRHDLAIGIGEAVRRVRAEAPGPIGLVALSTTLATNALVEGRGGRAALLLAGLDEASLRRGGLAKALGDAPVALIAGGHRADGSEEAPLDEAAAEAAVARLAGEAEAFAVCAQFAVRNPAHERRLAMIARTTGLPVTCSHELTAKLDAPRRALTTLLNARLIPEIAALLDAVEALLGAEGITAALMVVTGDGSLLAAAQARLRPVETILSGPAASVVGAAFLAGVADALVADVGGTTTDIALLKGGRPRLSSRGAVVGGHATMIEAIDVHTAGLGGDSELHHDADARPALGPRRVVPLSLLARTHPEIVGVMAEQLARSRPREHDARFLLRRRLPAEAASLGPSARRLWQLLADGPVPLERVVEREHLGIAMRRLVDRGLAVGAGFTPSDAAHLLGQQQGWSVEAARLGALLMARRLGPDLPDADSLARLVLDLAARRTGELLLEAALAAEGEPAAEILGGPAHGLVARALGSPSAAPLVRARLELTVPVVAVGGPARIFYPAPVERLGTTLIVPPHHATGNAVGAVVGRVERRASVLLTGEKEGAWRVHLAEGPLDLAELETALVRAEAAARALAEAEARAAGAASPLVTVERRERAFVDDAGSRRVLEVLTVATATGRPAFVA